MRTVEDVIAGGNYKERFASGLKNAFSVNDIKKGCEIFSCGVQSRSHPLDQFKITEFTNYTVPTEQKKKYQEQR